MIIKFTSSQIRGDGIGKSEVVPTINLLVPQNFDLVPGIYASQARFLHDSDKVMYRSALHYGPRPTFGKNDISLELHILSPNLKVNHGEVVEVEITKFIRPIKKFTSSTVLRDQILKDVVEINNVFSSLA